MRNCLVLAVAVLALAIASPAFAGDGNVPKSTLSSVGLGQMSVQSDSFGMQVRGKSSNALSTTASAFAVFLFDPNTGSQFNLNGNAFGTGSAENAGLNAASAATATSLTQQTAVNFAITFNGATFNATFAAFGITGAGSATGL
jgi:hypothetical protein